MSPNVILMFDFRISIPQSQAPALRAFLIASGIWYAGPTPLPKSRVGFIVTGRETWEKIARHFSPEVVSKIVISCIDGAILHTAQQRYLSTHAIEQEDFDTGIVVQKLPEITLP
jgi:hypothetical protein